MGPHGSPLGPNGHGGPYAPHMGPHGFPWIPHDSPWGPRGSPWAPLVSPWGPMGPMGVPVPPRIAILPGPWSHWGPWSHQGMWSCQGPDKRPLGTAVLPGTAAPPKQWESECAKPSSLYNLCGVAEIVIFPSSNLWSYTRRRRSALQHAHATRSF